MQNNDCCKVLLVDDDESDYVLVREWLALAEAPSFDLLWADGYASALKMMEEHVDTHAILIDYDLGGYSGLDLLREINRRGYSGPTIMLTGRGGRDVDQEALRLGVSEYLAKSETTPRLLERTLRYAIEHKRVEDELRKANASLAQANASLAQANASLAQANAELANARDELEERVLERTAELQRKQEELAYQAYLLENVSDAIVATDADYNLTAWNQAAERIYGWSTEEALGRPVNDLLQPERVDGDLDAAIRRLRETGALSGEFYESTRDGRRIIIESKTIALADAQGRFTGYVGVNRDITERKAQENLIRAYTERMEALAQLSQTLALTGRDLPAVIEAVSHRVVELIGDDCGLALLGEDGRTFTQVKAYHPNPEAQALIEDVFTHQVYTIDQDLAGRVARTGKTVFLPTLDRDAALAATRPEYAGYLARFPVHGLMIVPMRTQTGVIGVLGMSRHTPDRPYTEDDLLFLTQIAERTALAIENARLFTRAEIELAERRQAEAALRASQALFERLFESTPDPTLLLDRDGCIRQVNRQTVNVFGYAAADLLGLDFSHLLTEPHRDFYQTFLDQARQQASDQPLHLGMDLCASHSNGSLFPIELSLAPFQSGERLGLICSVHDITLRKRMEQELAEVPRRLLEGLEAERMRLARELHDGPIQEAYGVAFGLRHAIAEANPPEVKRLEGLLDQTHHAIQTMRDIGRNLRPPTLAHFGLEKTIRADADQFREHHPHIDVQLRLQPDTPDIPEHTRMALFRVYQNAMGNVARHSNASQVIVRLLFDAETVSLDIEDNGRGFNFDGSWLDLVRRGHLGLAGSNERAEAIGGRLEIDSTPGQGTRIRVTAPLEMPSRLIES